MLKRVKHDFHSLKKVKSRQMFAKSILMLTFEVTINQ